MPSFMVFERKSRGSEFADRVLGRVKICIEGFQHTHEGEDKAMELFRSLDPGETLGKYGVTHSWIEPGDYRGQDKPCEI